MLFTTPYDKVGPLKTTPECATCSNISPMPLPMLERNQSFALNDTEPFSEKQEVEGEGTKKKKPFHLMECKFLCFPQAFVGR